MPKDEIKPLREITIEKTESEKTVSFRITMRNEHGGLGIEMPWSDIARLASICELTIRQHELKCDVCGKGTGHPK